ncbi:MAG TPA: acyl-CoA dehydrogenase family protein [Rubrivivax sp.]|nr:acyl-CoA dehydrogenase family protein [Rubrivivax sp.]
MDFELSPDQRRLQELVADFARREIEPQAERLDREGVFPTALFRQLGELGVTAIPFAPEYGGMGLGTLEMALAIEQIAIADQSLAVTTMVSIATGLILQRFGTPEQKARWLPDLVKGQALGALAGTEPQAGSDTASFTTRATRVPGGWAINGQKAYITNAGTDISTIALTLAATSEPGAERKSFTLFIVPRGTPGYTQGEPYRKMGWRSSDTRPLYYDDCRVGEDAILGKEDEGRHLLHKGYQQARVFLAHCSLGLAEASLRRSVAYANERKAFGGTIGKLQMIQELVAQMAVKVDAARLLAYRAACMGDQGTATIRELAMAKYYCTEIGSQVADAAIQVHGGWGFMDDCAVSRYYRDNRICTIGDGSSQIQQLLIARSLGLDVRFES